MSDCIDAAQLPALIPQSQLRRDYRVPENLIARLPQDKGEPYIPLDDDGRIIWREMTFIDVSKRGKPLPTYANIRMIMDIIGMRVRYNNIKKIVDVIIPDFMASVDNYNIAARAYVEDEIVRAGISLERFKTILTQIGDENVYNPIADWISLVPWDGVDRLEPMYATIETHESHEKIKRTLMFKWFVAAIAALYDNSNNSVSRGVLIFQGAQYMGKTSWLKSLAPESMNVIKDGVMLDLTDKDSIYKCLTYWLVELGEIGSTFRKSDQDRLKAFLSESHDQLRRPFAPEDNFFKRRTVFFGSVNDSEFLSDKTGNTRYWCIPCKSINFQHGIDMQQFWAQIKIEYDNGAQWYLTYEEMAELGFTNEVFKMMDAVEEEIAFNLDWRSPKQHWLWLAASEIAKRLGMKNMSKRDLSALKQKVLEMNGNQSKRSNGIWLMYVPPITGSV